LRNDTSNRTRVQPARFYFPVFSQGMLSMLPSMMT
jgi:hypothetical protein